MMRRMCLALYLLMLTSCTTSNTTDAVTIVTGTRLIADNGVSLTPTTGWWLVHQANCHTIQLTSGGTDIDRFELHTGIIAGSVLPIGNRYCRTSEADAEPHQRSQITYPDIQSAFLETLRQQKAQNIRSMYLRQTQFGAERGFRFEYAYTDKYGINRQGLVLGAQRAGALDLAVFDAPALYYFNHLRPDAEEMFASIRTP